MGLAAALLAAAMVRYWLSFSELSSDPKYWDAFGSYLAGVSALVVGFATIVLLLRNVDLLKHQVAVAQQHLDAQQALIKEQSAALGQQERKERRADAERAIGRVLEKIGVLEERACKDWEAWRINLQEQAKRASPSGNMSRKAFDAVLRERWGQFVAYPSLLKLRGLLIELETRCVEAEQGKYDGVYWDAWIAASLPDTAIKALHCEAHQSPEGATAQWVRRAALMRFASTAVRLQEWHEIVGLPLPFPVADREISPTAPQA